MIVIWLAVLVVLCVRIERLGKLKARRRRTPADEAMEEWRRLELRAAWCFFAGWMAAAPAWVVGYHAAPDMGGAIFGAGAALVLAAIPQAIFSTRAKRILDDIGVSRKEAMARKPARKEKEA